MLCRLLLISLLFLQSACGSGQLKTSSSSIVDIEKRTELAAREHALRESQKWYVPRPEPRPNEHDVEPEKPYPIEEVKTGERFVNQLQDAAIRVVGTTAGVVVFAGFLYLCVKYDIDCLN